MQAHERFSGWIRESGIKKGVIAARLGVGVGALSRWLGGHAVPLPVYRRLIESMTDGTVKSEDWK